MVRRRRIRRRRRFQPLLSLWYEQDEPWTGRLTDAEFATALQVRDEWLAWARCTDPADRAAAEGAIGELYRMAGHTPPEMIWVDSPAAANRLFEASHAEGLSRFTWRGYSPWDKEPGMFWALKREREARPNRLRKPVSRRAARGVEQWMEFRAAPADSSLRLRDVLARPVPVPLGMDSVAGDQGAWIAVYDLARRLVVGCYTPRSRRQLGLWEQVSRSCGWWWPYEFGCVISERPARVHLETTARGGHRPHRADGPALLYRDGTAEYVWHGVSVPKKVIDGAVTAADWLDERNNAVRWAIADRMGYGWLLDQCDAVKIATDDYGTLWRIPDRRPTAAGRRGEDIVVVAVDNSTPEPDGTYRRYVIRVPPDQRIPRDAIGWTFGLPPAAYGPETMT